MLVASDTDIKFIIYLYNISKKPYRRKELEKCTKKSKIHQGKVHNHVR
jgi:hypothetical protein